MKTNTLRIGWASVDLTPTEAVAICGQFHVRISEGVRDPISATALAIESPRDGERGRAVLVSCDLVGISASLRDAVRAHLAADLPELDPALVVFNATHTHTAPEVRLQQDVEALGGILPNDFGVDLDVASTQSYCATIARRIADAVILAWKSRQPGAIAFGLGHASVGYNRRIAYDNGETRMYGNPDSPDFSHVEAGNDTSVNLLYTFDADRNVTGVVVNVACPSQVSEQEYRISADYWHETREEIRSRLGEHVFILPQDSATGDVTPARPVTLMDWKAQQRMWRLMGIDQRRDIGRRIAHVVETVLPVAMQEIIADATVRHRGQVVALRRRRLTGQDVDEALAQAATIDKEYQQLKQDLDANPQKRSEPRWYRPVTAAFRRAQWYREVAVRFARQDAEPTYPAELHVIRIGDLVIATNPFELYLDFGQQIKARSKAVQTFVVQLAGGGTYLPTVRATQGKSYGAVPASTPVGPEGGKDLVEWTVAAIAELMTAEAAAGVS